MPSDSIKFGGSSHFQPTDSRAGSVNNSGRNSPVHLPAQAWQEDNQVSFEETLTHVSSFVKLVRTILCLFAEAYYDYLPEHIL